MEEDQLKPFRQPLITATGILLGFTLNVAANWVSKAFTTNRLSEYLIAFGIFIHIPLYIIVLYRILNISYPRDKQQAYYKRTLFLFILGISIDFLSIVMITIERFIENRG
jgi:hypothetical protein